MDTPDQKTDKGYAVGDEGAVRSFLHTSLSFLAESSDAFGLVPDACPLVTDHLMVAANGYATKGHEGTPMLEMPAEGVEGLTGGLFRGLLKDTEESRAALRVALGNDHIPMENPVSRYCAALAEALALQVFHEAGRHTSLEQTCVLLSQILGEKLAELKRRLSEDRSLEDVDGVFFGVSLGCCRIRDGKEGRCTVEIYSAGDFRVYLLDEEGMSPLWTKETAVVSPDSPVCIEGRRFELEHPRPFAILLISESVYDLSPSEYHILQESGGMIWRYRMRLEDQFLRLVTDCVHDYEFGARATRFFSGRSRDRKCATGALSVRLGGSSFEVFRNACRDRLAGLEKLIALLPKGYDPRGVKPLPSRTVVETEHLRRLTDKSPALGDRVREALRQTVLDNKGGGPSAKLLPAGSLGDNRRVKELGEHCGDVGVVHLHGQLPSIIQG
jgi:hypothetical protein